MDLLGGLGVDPLQLLIQRQNAFLLCALLQPGTKCGIIFLLGKSNAVQQAGNIQPRAAHQNGQLSALSQHTNGFIGQLYIFSHAECLFGIADIQKMMRHLGLLGRGGLGRAHIQPAIDLHGIGRDHLAAKAARNGQRKGCFAAGGGPADHNDFGFTRFCQSAFPAPFG